MCNVPGGGKSDRVATGREERAAKWNRYRKARDALKRGLSAAKANWAAKEIDKLENLSLAPWEAWRAMMRIATGWELHHVDATGNCTCLRKEDGTVANTAEENMEVLETAFTDDGDTTPWLELRPCTWGRPVTGNARCLKTIFSLLIDIVPAKY